MDKKFLLILALFLATLGAAVLLERPKEKPLATPSSSPLSVRDAQSVVSGQQEAQRIWDEEKMRLGDSIQAKRIAAGRIASLPGVRSAGVTATGNMIWIEYDTGIKGGVMTQPEDPNGVPTLNSAP